MTLPRNHTPTERADSERDRAYNGVFTTALEGGIGYWSVCSRYKWHVVGTDAIEATDFIAVIETTEEETPTEYVIDRGVIARGIRLASEHGGWNTYHKAALADLRMGHWDDLDYDADTADLIVQFGLFDSQVYA